jgi:hypothetical protein
MNRRGFVGRAVAFIGGLLGLQSVAAAEPRKSTALVKVPNELLGFAGPIPNDPKWVEDILSTPPACVTQDFAAVCGENESPEYFLHTVRLRGSTTFSLAPENNGERLIMLAEVRNAPEGYHPIPRYCDVFRDNETIRWDVTYDRNGKIVEGA